jgi:hypothetical protein
VSVRKVKLITVKMETVTLTGKGTIWYAVQYFPQEILICNYCVSKPIKLVCESYADSTHIRVSAKYNL